MSPEIINLDLQVEARDRLDRAIDNNDRALGAKLSPFVETFQRAHVGA